MSIFNAPKEATAAPAAKNTNQNTSIEKKAGENMQKEQEVKVVEQKPAVPNYKDEIAVVSPSTTIEGNITTEGNLVMSGKIVGNIKSKGNLILNGSSNGDISCESVVLDACDTTSNVTASMNVIIKEGTKITGNIKCKSITIVGTVKGNINADTVFLKKTAVVSGDITAKQFMMEAGAKLKGKVDC